MRDLTFDVPSGWHFIYNPKETSGGYTPDALAEASARTGLTVLPGRLADVIPPEAIVGSSRIEIGGRGARAV